MAWRTSHIYKHSLSLIQAELECLHSFSRYVRCFSPADRSNQGFLRGITRSNSNNQVAEETEGKRKADRRRNEGQRGLAAVNWSVQSKFPQNRAALGWGQKQRALFPSQYRFYFLHTFMLSVWFKSWIEEQFTGTPDKEPSCLLTSTAPGFLSPELKSAKKAFIIHTFYK